ncbi:hypothetical protein VT50_0226365 [Streptomyces antioxidans]|uniref:PE-PGRS family protein n=1 Tax=Streptomyces antioxidans TaxID=1507734 RepID=A0A1V4CZN0_9ACTN|nr:hypothetical protein [Streptomyces antioxidans]OPF74705.1 hypothetical protein VT50_0226365 [Streptomyces antioxidans]
MSAGPPFRLARAAVFAAVCVVVTALGHALMSGDTLPVWSVAAAFAGTTAAAWWVAGRERGALVVTGATVVAQLGLHMVFRCAEATVAPVAGSAMGDGARGTRDTGAAPMSGGAMGHMHHGADAMSATAPSMGQLPWPWAGPGGPGMAMVHLLAALICGLWLWRGERAVFRLGRALAALLFVPLVLVLRILGASATPPPAWPSAPATARRLRGALLRHVILRRGPPARFATR